jgi:single-strand DNA-binding protein
MSNETYVTIIGTMTADAEIRFTPSGAAVASFSVATNARKFNKQTNEWEKKPPKFWRCQAWNQGKALLADNIANVLKKGDTVVVYGELETREYVTKEGEKRSADELRVEGIGKDLRWHQAYANDVPTRPAAEGWGAPPAQQTNAGGLGNGGTQEPPF